MLAYPLWRSFARVTGFVGKRTVGKDFDELMALGCSVVRSGPPGSGVALTFDDGPHPEWTPRILDALASHGVAATFFCVGDNAAAHPDLVRRIAAAGHEVGNHTQTHPDLHLVSPARLKREITQCQGVLEDLLGRPVPTFRAPYGRFRWDMKDPQALGLRHLVRWNVAPDPLSGRAADYAAVIEARTDDGAIILLHDNLCGVKPALAGEAIPAVIGSLPTVLPALLRRGFRFRTVSDQLAFEAQGRQEPSTARRAGNAVAT
jgi:peptidoglycan-N-acetylglucosamine deacetylase